MAVLERPELEASPLADLHAIADQIGLEGFRRLRKADLIDAILGERDPAARREPPMRRATADEDRDAADAARARAGVAPRPERTRRRAAPASPTRGARATGPDGAPAERGASADEDDEAGAGGLAPRVALAPRPRQGSAAAEHALGRALPARAMRTARTARIAAGVVEVLGNGSAFLRVDPPEPSDEDVYISAAQVRRCELVSGDRVTGPVRTPRRSERYPSLVRIDTINGASADTVSDGARYDELPVDWPRERLALGSQGPHAGGDRVADPARPRLARGDRRSSPRGQDRDAAPAARSRCRHARTSRLSLVLAGARPEEIAQWQEGPLAPVAALSFAASADSQGQAVERAIDAAKRVASRGGDALVAIDSLDGLHPHAARKALAAARNLRDGGSLTVIATAERPLGGETTVIALDAALTSHRAPADPRPRAKRHAAGPSCSSARTARWRSPRRAAARGR